MTRGWWLKAQAAVVQQQTAEETPEGEQGAPRMAQEQGVEGGTRGLRKPQSHLRIPVEARKAAKAAAGHR